MFGNNVPNSQKQMIRKDRTKTGICPFFFSFQWVNLPNPDLQDSQTDIILNAYQTQTTIHACDLDRQREIRSLSSPLAFHSQHSKKLVFTVLKEGKKKHYLPLRFRHQFCQLLFVFFVVVVPPHIFHAHTHHRIPRSQSGLLLLFQKEKKRRKTKRY